MAVKFDSHQDPGTKQVLDGMRKTHARFFTSNGYFELASRHYDNCNMIKNSPVPSLVVANTSSGNNALVNDKTTITTTSSTTTLNFVPQILMVNVTLMCVRKSDLNSYLAYNTLYFWLEHTMTISVFNFYL
jgi:hypothetical protein